MPEWDQLTEETDMTRDNAREIAVHLIFSLGFGTQSADEVLESELNRERFDELAQEMPVYAQYPNEKQETYIKNLVRGAFAHGPELDDYISRYAVGWSFERIPAGGGPSCGRPCMRSCICRTSQTPPPSTRRWS